jgi:hypothetical protein
MIEPRTLGELKNSRWAEAPLRGRSVRDEIRHNLLNRLGSSDPLFPGIVGYEDTILPSIVNALLARHHFILLGLRGQAKSRILRELTSLLDECIPVVAGSEVNDDPFAPISKYARELLGECGDATPIAWLRREQRYVEKLDFVENASRLGGGLVVHNAYLEFFAEQDLLCALSTCPAGDLSIPLDVEEWIAAFDAMRERRIDVGEVNGRIFLHKVVIGFVPGIAAGREYIRGRGGIGAVFGFLRYFFRRLFRARRLAVTIRPSDGPPRVIRVQALAVATNAYEEGFARFFSRPRLDAGTLTLYILKHLGVGDLARLLVAKLLGNWRGDAALEIESVESVTIRSARKSLNVMIDGEVETMQTPLDFTIRPGALRVLAPVAER